LPAYFFYYFRRVIKSVERRYQVDAARTFLQLADQLDRNADAFLRALFTRRPHSLADGFGYKNARHFPLQEGGVAIRGQRQDAYEDMEVAVAVALCMDGRNPKATDSCNNKQY